jgi:predicted AlkP superfamily phosphohydrolase/phosphomutase
VKSRKVLFIELDGATWDVINPLLEKGKLPNLEALMLSGASGRLLSIPPLVSPRIWTSIFSGKSAEKTGVAFFGANSKMVKCKRIWDIFDEMGLKVGVCGTFVTWPPYKVNGFMIPSVDALGPETYPSRYQPFQEMALNETRKGKALGGRYVSYIEYLYYARQFKAMGVSLKTLLDMFRYFVREKLGHFNQKDRQWRKAVLHLRSFTDLFVHLYGLFEPDFATFHIHICDYISHRFWEFYEPYRFSKVDADKVRRYGPAIPDAYIEADKAIGKILSSISKDTAVVIASDHGFEALPKRGYDFRHETVLEILGIRKEAIVIPCGGGIYLKFQDENLMQRTAGILSKVRLEETGDRIYNVKAFGNILILTLPTWKIDAKHIRDDAPVRFADLGVYNLGEIFSEAQMSGWHSEEGVAVLTGSGITAGTKLKNTSIYDLTPTILYLMGYPVGRDMDGKVMTEAFNDKFLDERPPEYIDSYEDSSHAAEEEPQELNYEKIEERLKSLGYL